MHKKLKVKVMMQIKIIKTDALNRKNGASPAQMVDNKRLAFSIVATLLALTFAFIDNSILNNGILGICFLNSANSIMKLKK